jgi:FAD/FMN-containing dehydrogenase
MTQMAQPWEQLSSSFLGSLNRPDDPDYERLRHVYNGLVDRRPAVIATCEGVADVVAALAYARAVGLPVGIRGGGHSVAGHGTCDGGVLVDLSRMRGVRVDTTTSTVRAEGGALLADVDRTTQLYGLATPTGQVSMTGIAGLALGGGLGRLQRKFGLTCDNLISADVVTADGQLLTVDAEHHPELLWALRGGGGNFGVVTSFEFQAHPVGPIVVAGMIAYTMDQAAEVAAFLRDFIADAPPELSADQLFMHTPPRADIPAEMHGLPITGVFVCHCGTIEDGLATLAPLRAFGSPVADMIQPMPYLLLQQMLDAMNPHGNLHYWTGEYLDELNDDAIKTIVDLNGGLFSPHSLVQLIPFNARPTEIAADATAFAHRSESWLVHILGQWTDPAQTPAGIAWAKGLGARIRELGTGDVYLNLVTDDEDIDRVHAFWDDERLERLGRVKARYDPDNVFRFNHNIKPALAVAS